MPTVVENAEVALAWKEACKLRKSLVKHIDRLIESNATANDKKTFDKVEDYVAKFRLSCMQIIFADFVYATENHVQRDLWEAQLHVSKLYRAVIRESRGQHVALRRIEKRYAGFLNLCQLFYEGYVQRLATAYELPVLANIAHRLNPNPNDKSLGGMIQPSDLPKELLEMVIAACHDALIALGDLARYHLKLKGKMNLYESAVSFYSLANDLNPAIAHGHHGIGLASVEVSKHFLVVYHMYRAVVAQEPHPNAMNNLATEFSHLRDPNASLATKDPSPQQVLEIIFVRLHAYFFVGNEMPKRDELEQAFFRRLEEVLLTIKPDEFSNILCMAIVNISACAVAKEKLSEPKAKPLFYQYVSAFNLRFAGYFAWIFTRRMYETYNLGTSSSSGKPQLGVAKGRKEPFVLDHIADMSLRVLRLYSAWLLSNQSELASQIKSFEKAITIFICQMARGLTTLTFFFQGHLENAAHECGGHLPISKYLLEEDNDIVQCPAMGTPAIDSILKNPDTEKPRQPFANYRKNRENLWTETIFRVADILTSSQRYTTDPTFPLTYAVLPGRKLAYAVDDKILPHAKDFDLGTGPSSKFPVCVSAIEELAPSQPTTPMNKDVETMEPEPEKIHSGKPAKSSESLPSPKTGNLELAPKETVVSVQKEMKPKELPSLSIRTQVAPIPAPLSAREMSLSPILAPPASALAVSHSHMMDDNSQPYSSSPLDGSRKIPALEWSSVYTPKPAGGAWKQLTADQYYSGPLRRSSQMGSASATASPLIGMQRVSTPAQNVEHRQQLLNTLLDGAASGITPASSPHLTSGYLQSMTPFQQSQQPVDPPPGFGNISSSTPFLHSSNIFQGTPQQLQPRNMVMASPTTMTGSQFESYQQQQQYMHARQQYSSSLNATENTTSNPPPGFSSGSYNPR
ncbi:hypothetical protein CFIMG_001817RA [Ceratocystis fimbriata CBS 114723]|uniref:Nonsense-mediated mRNA decay factor n=1 Tax=Ceratocystis fimbriata CBS 114723 TaxID=1035309 RepID=A0A2C5X5N0_9PEZI|nr:hypothetical protein CFIMG_001817RA [Ceratocystis fimbriata CBS 114723]